MRDDAAAPGTGTHGTFRPSAVTIQLSVERLLVILALCVAVVWGLGVFRQVVVALLNVDTDAFHWNIINVDFEKNIPTLFSMLQLFCGAALATFVAVLSRQTEPQNTPGWSLLALLFLCMCAEEMLQFHEMTGDILNKTGINRGLLYFPWIIWGLPLALVVGGTFVPFLRRLPRTTARRLVVAGAIYLGGAIGMEAVGGLAAEARGRGDWYALCFLLEEGGEMLGAMLFIRALLFHIVDSTSAITLAVHR
jgi:hypothetical protein